MFLKHIAVVLSKTARKNSLYSKNETILKLPKIAAKQSKKLNIPKKTCTNRFYNHIEVVLCKKSVEKTTNIPDIRRF